MRKSFLLSEGQRRGQNKLSLSNCQVASWIWCYTKFKLPSNYINRSMLLLAFALFFTSISYAQGDPCPGIPCTAGDIKNVSYFLGDAAGDPLPPDFDCTPPEVINDVYIYVNFEVNSTNRYEINVAGDIFIDGVYDDSFDICLGDYGSGDGVVTIQAIPLSWNCGEELTIVNSVFAWQQNEQGDNPDMCTTCPSAPSKCRKFAPIVVEAPLIPNFSYDASCVGLDSVETISFTDLTTGGEETYSYSWDFDNDGIEDATSANPSYTYPSAGTYTVSLTVTDSSDPPVTKTIEKEIVVAICCNFGSPTCLLDPTPQAVEGCDASAVGAGTAYAPKTTITDVFGMLAPAPCGDLTMTSEDVTSGSLCPPDGLTITRTYTLFDDLNDNDTLDPDEDSFTCVEVFTIIDETAPEVTPSSGSEDYEGECDDDLTAVLAFEPTFTDNCTDAADLEITLSDETTVDPGCANAYVRVRTWTADDGCGNETEFTQTITITDDTAPEVTPSSGSEDYEGECSDDLTAVLAFEPTFTDNCTDAADLEISLSDETTVDPDCANAYVRVRTWTADDGCGNETEFTQTITITDDTAPEVTPSSGSEDYEGECDDDLTAVLAFEPTFTDSCTDAADLEISLSDETTVDPDCANAYVRVRTWTADDGCGNETEFTQTITITDDTAPEFVEPLPESITINCDDEIAIAPAPTLTATDNCDATVTVDFEETDDYDESCANYTITRVWTVTDSCGNENSHTQEVSIVDNVPPTVDTSDLLTEIECGDSTDPSNTGFPIVEDNCSETTSDYEDSDCFGVEDPKDINSGNGRYFSFEISGYDELDASDIGQLELDFETNKGKGHAQFILIAPNGEAVVLVGEYCQDPDSPCVDDSPNTKERYNPTFYSCSEGYPNWNNIDAIPESPNTGNFSPHGGEDSSSVPNDIDGLTSYVDCFEDFTGEMNGTWTVFAVKEQTFNGSVKFYSVCLTPTDCRPVIVRDWTISDACGNSADYQQVIRVIDSQGPVPPTIDTEITVGCDIPEPMPLTAVDACDGEEITVDPVDTVIDESPDDDFYIIERVWTFTDVCGNETVLTQTITVDCCVELELWVYLEGSLIDSQGQEQYNVPMRTDLNDARLLPGQSFSDIVTGTNSYTPALGEIDQAYNITPWLYSGNEGDGYDSGGDATMGQANYPETVTDWVLVSLRTDPEDGSEAICQHAALLHETGKVEYVGGECCSIDISQPYYIVVEHRNHLIVMSHEAVMPVGGVLSYDFRYQQSYINDPLAAGYVGQIEVLPGIYAMYAGNGEQSNGVSEDTDINAGDFEKWDEYRNIFGEYVIGDYDMNGDVNANDYDLWFKNRNVITSVPRD